MTSRTSAGPASARLHAAASAVSQVDDALPWRCVAAIAAGLAGGFLAAGSAGSMGHALRHALTWAAFLTVVVAGWEASGRPLRERLTAIILLCIAGVMLTSSLYVANILGMALALCAVGLANGPAGLGRPFLWGAAALGVFAVYRAAYLGIPTVFLLADGAGALIGRLGGAAAGRPLNVGATFAGLDFLVLMTALGAVAALDAPSLARRIAGWGIPAICAAQLLYLIVLANVPEMLGEPPPPQPARLPSERPPPKPFVEWIRPLVPWNLPAVGAALHVLVAAGAIRLCWRGGRTASSSAVAGATWRIGRLVVPRWPVAVAGTALLFAACTNLWWHRPTLEGKKIVFFEKGFLNWLAPRHGDYGRLSIGMYGMMEHYIRSLGGTFVKSPELSEEDLRGASAVVLLFPNEPWKPGQLDRLVNFARNGGTLAIFGEHTIHEAKGAPVLGDAGESRFNEVLAAAGASMYVPFDSATFQIGGWLQSYEQIAHPTSAGLGDDRNQFGVVIGASVRARLPARPIIVGRWGYNDPGDDGSDAALMGNHRYDNGDRLGDIILAAEQPLGKGKIVLFGDTSNMTNGITVGAHVYTTRLLAYLGEGGRIAHPAWRQLLAAIAAAALMALVVWLRCPVALAAGCVALAAGLSAFTAISEARARVLPDGRRSDPNNLAYVTSSHLEASSDESWRPDGTMGLVMNLMRNGYLTLYTPEISFDRLERAALLVSVAPQKPFNRSEIRAIRRFMENGGVFILTAGYDCCEASRGILREFGFWVGRRTEDDPEPEPMGHFKSPYIHNKDENYMAHVRFHAGWPVGCDSPNAQVIAYGRGNKPIILMRPVGRGRMIVVGDTCFAMNKNLEWESGEPFEGMRENADFWRWLVSYLRDPSRQWVPPKPKPPEPRAAPVRRPAAPPPQRPAAQPQRAPQTRPASAATRPATLPVVAPSRKEGGP